MIYAAEGALQRDFFFFSVKFDEIVLLIQLLPPLLSAPAGHDACGLIANFSAEDPVVPVGPAPSSTASMGECLAIVLAIYTAVDKGASPSTNDSLVPSHRRSQPPALWLQVVAIVHSAEI